MSNTEYPSYFEQETERVYFRELTLADIPSWLEFFENNDRLRFLGIDLRKDHPTIASEWIHMQLDRYVTQGFGHLAAISKESGAFIGMAGIIPRLINNQEEYEIAYSLKPNFWGHGYGTEMAQQMRRFGLQNQISKTFISIIHKENYESIHVAEKNNMVKDYEMHYMEMDVIVYRTNEF